MRVAIAALKGGSGKTTTAVYLSEVASAEGRTLAVDADPQGSLTSWAERSPDGLGAAVVALPTRQLARELARIGDGYRHVVVDCPPGDVAITRAAALAVDVVVVPMAPSALEVDRLHPTLDLAAEVDRPAVVLVCRARPVRATGEAVEALGAAGIPYVATVVPLRQAIADTFGTRPVELYGYDAVWAELRGAIEP